MKVAGSLAIIIVCYYLFSTIDCRKSLGPTLVRTFQHAGPYHLIINLMALPQVAALEKDVGSCTLLILVSLLIIGTTSLEMMFPPSRCAVGLSGILFGILTWEAFRVRHVQDAAILVSVYLLSSALLPNVSFWGHAQGVATGALVWFVFKDQIVC